VPKAHHVGLSMRRGSPRALLVPVVRNPRHIPGALPWAGLLEKLVEILPLHTPHSIIGPRAMRSIQLPSDMI